MRMVIDDRNQSDASIKKLNHHPMQWLAFGECALDPEANPNDFISSGDSNDDAWYPKEAALKFCRVCIVRVQCLDSALANDESGTWGGTTEFQRRQLKRKAVHMVCPGCASREIVTEGKSEVCISCGISWPVIN